MQPAGSRPGSQALLVRQLNHRGPPTKSSGTVLQCPTSRWFFSKTKPHSQQLLINENEKEKFSFAADCNVSLKKISIYYRHVYERDGLSLEYFISNISRHYVQIPCCWLIITAKEKEGASYWHQWCWHTCHKLKSKQIHCQKYLCFYISSCTHTEIYSQNAPVSKIRTKQSSYW